MLPFATRCTNVELSSVDGKQVLSMCTTEGFCAGGPGGIPQSPSASAVPASILLCPWTDISSTSPTVSPDPCTTEHCQQSGGGGGGGDLSKSSSMVSFCHSLYEDEDPQMSTAAKQCKRCQFLEARAALTGRMNQLSARRPPRVPSPYPSHTWDEDSLASSELTVVASLARSQSSSPSGTQAGVQKAQANACDLQSALNCQTHRVLGSCINEHKLTVGRDNELPKAVARTYETGHEFKFVTVKIIAHVGSKTSRGLIDTWASGKNSAYQCIELAPAYRALRSHLQTCVIDR
ncbi:hypothetical protein SprV_0602134600 [Sparganum proliferum]